MATTRWLRRAAATAARWLCCSRVSICKHRASLTVDALPTELLQRVFELLRDDGERARCAMVCRAWRAALAEQGDFLRLCMTPAAPALSSNKRKVSVAALHDAARRGGGRLRALDVSRCQLGFPELLAFVQSGAAPALRELRVCDTPLGWSFALSCREIEALLVAAPLLELTADTQPCTLADARRMLLNEGVFARLRLRLLRVWGRLNMQDAAALLTWAAAHSSLEGLELDAEDASADLVLHAVAEFAVARSLSVLELGDGFVQHVTSPALAGRALTQLMHSGAFTDLIYGSRYQCRLTRYCVPAFFEGVVDAGAARHECVLFAKSFNDFHSDSGLAFMAAATSRPNLRCMWVLSTPGTCCCNVSDEAVEALGVLLRANAPQLESLWVNNASKEIGERLLHRIHGASWKKEVRRTVSWYSESPALRRRNWRWVTKDMRVNVLSCREPSCSSHERELEPPFCIRCRVSCARS